MIFGVFEGSLSTFAILLFCSPYIKEKYNLESSKERVLKLERDMLLLENNFLKMEVSALKSISGGKPSFSQDVLTFILKTCHPDRNPKYPKEAQEVTKWVLKERKIVK